MKLCKEQLPVFAAGCCLLLLRRIIGGEGRDRRDIKIVSFRVDGNETTLCEEDDWDALRCLVTSRFRVKEKAADDPPAFQHDLESILVLENWVTCVRCLHNSISSLFRDGRCLESLIQDLQSGHMDPMTNANMVVRIANAEFRDGPPKFYTFDHKRLYCLWQARVPNIRVSCKVARQGIQ